MDDHGMPSLPAMPPPPPSPGAFGVVFPATPAIDRTVLRELAARQRWAIIAGIANAVGGVIAFAHALPPEFVSVAALGVAVFVVVAGYRLARQLHGVGIGVLCGIAMLVPILWIVVLVMLSSRASKTLRAAGVRVGFFGADPSTI